MTDLAPTHFIPGPPWFELAQREIGVKEVPGPQSNPAILEYARDARLPWEYESDETAWCAIFANAMLERCGIRGTRSAWARDFLKWGRQCDPTVGCIAVLTRDGGGHVMMFGGFSSDGTMILGLGGNQSDTVKWSWFPRSRVLGFRLPSAVEPTIPVSEKIKPAPGEVEDELREKGSRTIDGADKVEAIVKTTGVSIGGYELLQYFRDFIPYAQNLTLSRDATVILCVLVIAGVIYYTRTIKVARVEDHITGKHTGR